MKTTAWIGGGHKPVRVGVYQTTSQGDINFQHWNGTKWGWIAKSVNDAYAKSQTTSFAQNRNWRGLTTKGGKL